MTVHQNGCNKQNDREHNIQKDIIKGEGSGGFCAGVDTGWALSHQDHYAAVGSEHYPYETFPVFLHDFQVFHIKQITGGIVCRSGDLLEEAAILILDTLTQLFEHSPACPSKTD